MPIAKRNAEATETKEKVEQLGHKAVVYVADLSSTADVANLTPKILADGHEVRVLINCAGIQIRHPCEDFPDADFSQVNHLGFAVFQSTPAPAAVPVRF